MVSDALRQTQQAGAHGCSRCATQRRRGSRDTVGKTHAIRAVVEKDLGARIMGIHRATQCDAGGGERRRASQRDDWQRRQRLKGLVLTRDRDRTPRIDRHEAEVVGGTRDQACERLKHILQRGLRANHLLRRGRTIGGAQAILEIGRGLAPVRRHHTDQRGTSRVHVRGVAREGQRRIRRGGEGHVIAIRGSCGIRRHETEVIGRVVGQIPNDRVDRHIQKPIPNRQVRGEAAVAFGQTVFKMGYGLDVVGIDDPVEDSPSADNPRRISRDHDRRLRRPEIPSEGEAILGAVMGTASHGDAPVLSDEEAARHGVTAGETRGHSASAAECFIQRAVLVVTGQSKVAEARVRVVGRTHNNDLSVALNLHVIGDVRCCPDRCYHRTVGAEGRVRDSCFAEAPKDEITARSASIDASNQELAVCLPSHAVDLVHFLAKSSAARREAGIRTAVAVVHRHQVPISERSRAVPPQKDLSIRPQRQIESGVGMVAVAVDIGANQTTCTKVIIEVAIAIVAQYDKVQSESEIRASRDQDLSIGLNLDACGIRRWIGTTNSGGDPACARNTKAGIQCAIQVKARQRKKPVAASRCRPHHNDFAIALKGDTAGHIVAAAKVGGGDARAVEGRVQRAIRVVTYHGKVIVAAVVEVTGSHHLAIALQSDILSSRISRTHGGHQFATRAEARVRTAGAAEERALTGEVDGD